MHHQLTDEELLLLMRQGDAAALGVIYDRYWESMSLYVLKMTQSYDDASDIVQEVFVSLWKRGPELAIRGPLRPYLMTAVRNRAIRYIENHLKKRNFLSSLSSHYEQLTREGYHPHHLETRELEDQLTGAVTNLPSRMKEVFILSRNENLTNKEIAARLNIAETTVKKQVSNALKVLRAQTGSLSITFFLVCWMLYKLGIAAF